MKKSNHNRITTVILFFIYIVALTWIILFKLSIRFSELPHLRGINLTPFAGSVIVNGKIYIHEIIDNIMVFIPFGIYLSMLKPDWNFLKKMIPIAGTSFFSSKY